MNVHIDSIKTCKYFDSNIECPFVELGCKFVHGKCRNGISESDEDQEDTEASAKEDNFCYFCEQDFDDPSSLSEHTIKEHMD